MFNNIDVQTHLDNFLDMFQRFPIYNIVCVICRQLDIVSSNCVNILKYVELGACIFFLVCVNYKCSHRLSPLRWCWRRRSSEVPGQYTLKNQSKFLSFGLHMDFYENIPPVRQKKVILASQKGNRLTKYIQDLILFIIWNNYN